MKMCTDCPYNSPPPLIIRSIPPPPMAFSYSSSPNKNGRPRSCTELPYATLLHSPLGLLDKTLRGPPSPIAHLPPNPEICRPKSFQDVPLTPIPPIPIPDVDQRTPITQSLPISCPRGALVPINLHIPMPNLITCTSKLHISPSPLLQRRLIPVPQSSRSSNLISPHTPILHPPPSFEAPTPSTSIHGSPTLGSIGNPIVISQSSPVLKTPNSPTPTPNLPLSSPSTPVPKDPPSLVPIDPSGPLPNQSLSPAPICPPNPTIQYHPRPLTIGPATTFISHGPPIITIPHSNPTTTVPIGPPTFTVSDYIPTITIPHGTPSSFKTHGPTTFTVSHCISTITSPHGTITSIKPHGQLTNNIKPIGTTNTNVPQGNPNTTLQHGIPSTIAPLKLRQHLFRRVISNSMRINPLIEKHLHNQPIHSLRASAFLASLFVTCWNIPSLELLYVCIFHIDFTSSFTSSLSVGMQDQLKTVIFSKQ